MNFILVLVFFSANWLAGFVNSVPIVAAPSSSVNNNNTEDMFGSFIFSQMLGSDSVSPDPNSFQLSNKSSIIETIGKILFMMIEHEDSQLIKQFPKILRSPDLGDRLKVLDDISERIERIMLSSEFAENLMQEQVFIELHSKASLANLGVNGSTTQTDKNPCNGPIPDIGKVNGLYGSESTLTMKEEVFAGMVASEQDPKRNGIQLVMIEIGFAGVPNPESRLGAYYATRGYNVGTVGSAVHRVIGSMYLILGSVAEEKIGRIYNNQAVKALLSQPVQAAATRCLAHIEQLYYTNVRKENPESLGARIGSILTIRSRDCIAQLLSGVLCSSS